jgi:hypothetical protein
VPVQDRGARSESYCEHSGNRLTAEFLPRLEADDVIDQTSEENEAGSWQQGPEQFAVLYGDLGVMWGQNEHKPERSCVGEDDGDTADTWDWLQVKLAHGIRLIDDVETLKDVPA